MVAVVEVDEGPAAKRRRAAEEGKPPPPPPPQKMVAAARKQRQPTPDHPPYCWMIGEAIDALGEGGGSEEASISAFIRARYPGVPAAHDRLLGHYLAKHVNEGVFVCTAAGRYARCLDETAAVEAAVSSEAARIEPPVTVAKRGRGRPRKDGSSLTSPAGKKDGSAGAQCATPKPQGRRRAAARLAADEASVPAASVDVADNDGSKAATLVPRRRRRLRKAMATDVSGEAPSTTDKEHEAPRELALVVVGDGSGETLITGNKNGNEAPPTTDKEHEAPRELELVVVGDGSGETLITGNKDGNEAPSTTDKENEAPRELALVIVGDGSATTSIVDNVCGEAPPTTPMDHEQPREVALVTANDLPALTPPMDDKRGGGEDPSYILALVAKHDGIAATSVSGTQDSHHGPWKAPEQSSQTRELALVVADNGSVPVLVADKKDGGEAPSAKRKRPRLPGKAVPVVIAEEGGSTPTSTAGKKAGRKAQSAAPKGHQRQREPALMPTGDRSAPTQAVRKIKKAGRATTTPSTPEKNSVETSGAPKLNKGPPKLYPVIAEEIPDDPACCLLALPCQKPAAANA